MNSLINAILIRKDVALANDGRLLKKLFLSFLILALAFQPRRIWRDVIRPNPD
jgi:hypothetical protein